MRAKRTKDKHQNARPPQGSDLLTSSEMFEAALDWVLGAVSDEGGWIIISRNSLPTAFIEPRNFDRWGAALHHHDLRVQGYAAGLRQRASFLKKSSPRTTLILPEQLEHWFVNLSARFDPHSDGPAGRMTTQNDRARIWHNFTHKWQDTIYQFDAGNIGDACVPTAATNGFAATVAKWQDVDEKFVEVTHIPDVWIGIKAGGELIAARGKERSDLHREVIEGVERVLVDEIKLRESLLRAQAGGPRGRGKVKTAGIDKLEADIKSGHIRIVNVSAAEFNPRYRGRIEKSTTAVTRLLASCAAGLVRSHPLAEPEATIEAEGRAVP